VKTQTFEHVLFKKMWSFSYILVGTGVRGERLTESLVEIISCPDRWKPDATN